MPAALVAWTLGVIACCASAHPPQLASVRAAEPRIDTGQGDPQAADGNTHLITASAMGRVRLRMTLDEARRALPNASFTRTSDAAGAVLVEIAFAPDDSLSVSADEDDAAAPIDWSRRIVTIETFSTAFHTREGIHPGSLVTDAVAVFGPVREIVQSEIESREFITFSRQPRALTFRLDYAGVFSPGARETTSYAPGAKILSIAISSVGNPE